MRFRVAAVLCVIPIACAAIFVAAAAKTGTKSAPSAKSSQSSSQTSSQKDEPRYTADGKLLRPEGYREWIFLSSGLGMSYSPGPADEDPQFTNVFVPQAAYQKFVATGKWPDKTVFIVEERGSSSNGSINKKGRFQTDFMGFGVEVKDESRFPEKWAYFAFDEKKASASAAPKSACWQCHEDHAAVEHTFVQFYPTLQPVAKKFGVYKKSAQ